jgi:predicted RNA binding protein YcfA (HicA-like mRNA interferase family)
MPVFGPISRKKLIKTLKNAGFVGPFSGGKHPFMKKGNLLLTVPNEHKSDIGKGLLAKILKQAGITKKEFERL